MLQGIELINCAKANAKKGTAFAAERSGYGNNIGLFTENLTKACQQIGVDFKEINDLITPQQIVKETGRGVEISPDTNSQL